MYCVPKTQAISRPIVIAIQCLLASLCVLLLGCQSDSQPAPERRKAQRLLSKERQGESASSFRAESRTNPKRRRQATTVIRQSSEETWLTRAEATQRKRRKSAVESANSHRYQANLVQAQNSELNRLYVDSVRHYSLAEKFATSVDERNYCRSKVNQLSQFVLATTQPPKRTEPEPQYTLKSDPHAALPKIPDYSEFAESELVQLSRHTGPAGRRQMILSGHSSFLAQARSAIQPRKTADRVAAERYAQFQRNERILRALNQKIQELLVFKARPHNQNLVRLLRSKSAFESWTISEQRMLLARHETWRAEILKEASLVVSVREYVRARNGSRYGGVGYRLTQLNPNQQRILADQFSSQLAAAMTQLSESTQRFDKFLSFGAQYTDDGKRLFRRTIDGALRRRRSLNFRQLAHNLQQLKTSIDEPL